MTNQQKVAVALSGGIDSAVTAALLIEQGYEVIGITGKMTCTEDSEQVVLNAKKVADKLNIEHMVIDVSKEFDEKIISYFKRSFTWNFPSIITFSHITLLSIYLLFA